MKYEYTRGPGDIETDSPIIEAALGILLLAITGVFTYKSIKEDKSLEDVILSKRKDIDNN